MPRKEISKEGSQAWEERRKKSDGKGEKSCSTNLPDQHRQREIRKCQHLR